MDYPLHIRKLMSRLQSRLEEEIQAKLLNMQSKIERKWATYLDDPTFGSPISLSKTEIKKIMLSQKEDIIVEIKDTQKSQIKREVKEQLETYESDFDSRINELQKRMNVKIENNHQDNYDTIKYIGERLNQHIENGPNSYSNTDIVKCKARIEDIERRLCERPSMGRSFVGHPMTEKDLVWQKVDNKLDKIYQYQQQMTTKDVQNDDYQKIYNKFGESIVSLVQNLIVGTKPNKENAGDFANLLEKVNENSFEKRIHNDKDTFDLR